jgi:hypothetical protein
MATYQILYWGHLPMRVRATDINGQKYAELSPRFMEAVNQASKLHGMDGTVMFRWSPAQEKEGTAEEVLEKVIKEIDKQFPNEIPLTPPEK